jgi:predicted component of type VI protein secretion system
MYQVERESQSTPARLMEPLRQYLPYMNFYRFCQLLEKCRPEVPVTGSSWQIQHEPVRFHPHPGMGFPAGEIRGMSDPEAEHEHLPPAVNVNFMGLYGVESPLPTHYIDDIAQKREGWETTRDFLDIFNHRLIAQYYRIWRKYSYPATFASGGTDNTSQYLLGLAGLGIPGCAATAGTADDAAAGTHGGGDCGASSAPCTKYLRHCVPPRSQSYPAEKTDCHECMATGKPETPPCHVHSRYRC